MTGTVNRPAATGVDALTADGGIVRCHGAVLAELAGAVVGVASFDRPGDGDRRAEFAVFVDDAQRGRGIGTLLLEHLAALARASGVAELIGEVLPANGNMMRVARDLSGRVFTRFADGVLDVGLSTTDDLAALDGRERHAELASLRPLLRPRSVASYRFTTSRRPR